MAAHIFQIFYDEKTRAAVHPALIPLDNMHSERSDWYELWPIRKQLHDMALVDGDWYGFLSPKFGGKYGMDPGMVPKIVGNAPPEADVILFSPSWDQRAYFLNSFEQGDYWERGLMAASQSFLDQVGVGIDVGTLVGTPENTVFSNYVVARASFWRDWLALADKLVACDDAPGTRLAQSLRQPTRYVPGTAGAPQMKVFVQERIACIVLSLRRFVVGTIDASKAIPLMPELFIDDAENHRLLERCEEMKSRFVETGDRQFLASYAELRRSVRTVRPIEVLADLQRLLQA